MAFGEVRFSEAGSARQPSPSIWGDCPLDRLNTSGRGWFVHEDFLGGVADTIASAEQSVAFGDLGVDVDEDTVFSFKTGKQGGYLDVETDGDNNDAAALFTQPFAQFVHNSGKKVWFEIRFELGATADQGLFFGFAEEDALDRDIVANDAGSVDTESMVGFQILEDDQDAADAIFRLDDGSVVEMQSVANDTDAQGDSGAALTADTERKLGFKFDGKETIEIFSDGTKVKAYVIDDDTFPTDVLMGAIAAIKTGTAAAQSFAVDWIRAAYAEER